MASTARRWFSTKLLRRRGGGRPHAIAMFPGDYSSGKPDDPANERQAQKQQDLLDAILKQRLELDEQQQQKWTSAQQAVERVSVIDERGRAYGRGARKRAHARVWIQPGFGHVVINQRPLVHYLTRATDREHALEPLVVTDTCGKFDVQISVQGGGLTGQAGAIRLGLARALQHYQPTWRTVLQRLGMLTRDARVVERKKVGKVKARKSPQWVRR